MGLCVVIVMNYCSSDCGGGAYDISGGEEGWAHYGASAMQGWRNSMEDAHLAALSVDGPRRLSLFGVFDGHVSCVERIS